MNMSNREPYPSSKFENDFTLSGYKPQQVGQCVASKLFFLLLFPFDLILVVQFKVSLT